MNLASANVADLARLYITAILGDVAGCSRDDLPGLLELVTQRSAIDRLNVCPLLYRNRHSGLTFPTNGGRVELWGYTFISSV
jgi:hypothetical protein